MLRSCVLQLLGSLADATLAHETMQFGLALITIKHNFFHYAVPKVFSKTVRIGKRK